MQVGDSSGSDCWQPASPQMPNYHNLQGHRDCGHREGAQPTLLLQELPGGYRTLPARSTPALAHAQPGLGTARQQPEKANDPGCSEISVPSHTGLGSRITLSLGHFEPTWARAPAELGPQEVSTQQAPSDTPTQGPRSQSNHAGNVLSPRIQAQQP